MGPGINQAGIVVYIWKNFYGQLGQAGQDVKLPKTITNCPWSKDTDIAIVTAKTQVGYVFTSNIKENKILTE